MQQDHGQKARLSGSLKRLVAWMFGIKAEDAPLSPQMQADLQVGQIRAQIEAILRERPIRLTCIALISAVFWLYLPWYAVLLPMLGVLAADHFEIRTMRHGQDRYPATVLALVYAGEIGFCLPAAIIWHYDDAFTKAISVGVFAAAMMRLATLRSIAPETGFAGLAALASLIAMSNSSYWVLAGNLPGFAFTSLIAIVSISYLAAAILQNHFQQRMAAIGKLAALSASDAKSRFLAQMSHELRTPLNAIIGTGTAAFLLTEDAKVREQLDILLRSASGLDVVLGDVLDLAAVEEGRITLRPRDADLAEEIALTVALFRPQAEAAGLRMHLDLHEPLPPSLHLDVDRLRQCLSNLLSNALKHTEEGEIRVAVRLEATPLLVITVQDTGRGVPPGDEERIFNRYERGASQSHGHGLGLSICRMLLTQMGGDITLAPSPKGASFQMRLPVTPREAPPPPTHTPPPAPNPGPMADLAGLHVLVVDDIATNRLVASTYLSLLHCRSTEVDTGPAALAVLENGGIDLVLLDMNMPGMNGMETLALIRSGPASRIPVMAMTADAAAHDRQRYLAAGLNGYVTKPIHLDALRAELSRVTAQRT